MALRLLKLQLTPKDYNKAFCFLEQLFLPNAMPSLYTMAKQRRQGQDQCKETQLKIVTPYIFNPVNKVFPRSLPFLLYDSDFTTPNPGTNHSVVFMFTGTPMPATRIFISAS